MKFKLNSKLIIPLFGLLLAATMAASFFLGQKTAKLPPSPKDPYIAFLTEIYDKTQQNYWEKLDDQQLINLYLAAARKFGQQPQLVKAESKSELFKLLKKLINQQESTEEREKLTTTIADAVLQNLKPFGRSRLYTQKQAQDLSNTVSNVDPNADHYQELDLPRNASDTAVESAYQQKLAQPQPKEKLEKITRAYNVLKDKTSRQIYDQTKADPTMPHRAINDKIYYLGIKKFSPTTITELVSVAKKTDAHPTLDTLILDLRDNVGGAIDGLPYFLGPFIGPDQYAYQFLHQGEKEDFKTKAGWLNSLVKFKKVVILINQNTQSSAEVMAAVLKKYHVGVLIGTPTRGWGTVEKVIALENQLSPEQTYSLFLVHSLTLREDGQPIEAKGVEPMININDKNWQQQLLAYFNYPALAQAINQLF